MSLELKVYTRRISDEIMSGVIARLNNFEMTCEVHPSFSFSDDNGYVPFRFQLTNPLFADLKDKVLTSGFELFVEEFSLQQEKQSLEPKRGLFDKILGKKRPENPFINPTVDQRLKDCDQVLTFYWQAGDSFELRFASLTSAIITELTDGVCTYPADDIWYDNENLTENTWKDVREYEISLLNEGELKYREFEGW